jgi:hypothetical protein
MITFGATLILITQVITLLTAGLSFWASRKNKAAITEIKVSIDGRMDEQLKLTKELADAIGHARGVADEKKNPS